MAHLAHANRIADDEERADRFPFASFPADLQRQVYDGLQRIERHAGAELLQVAYGEPAEMVVEIDDAHRIQ